MRLTIRFAPPGAFVNDPRLVVSVGERTVYDGKFKSGFDASVDVPPGAHDVTTAVYMLGLPKRQTIRLPLDGPSYRDVAAVEARLSYSRLRANFEPRASLSTKS